MMRWIVSTSIKFRFLVVALGGAMMLFGITQLRQMPVDVFPEFAPPKVEIQTVTLGLSPAETETLVTIPLEQALAGVPHLDFLRSKSLGQLSQIEMIFERGTDLLLSRQLIQERLQSVAPNLPTWAAPPVMLQPLSSTSRVMKIGISSDDVSVIDQSMTAYWKIRARLLRVPGVANAVIWGERIDMQQVQVIPELLLEKDITLDQVMEATSDTLDSGLLQYTNGSVVGKGGFIDTANQRLTVRHILPITTPEDLAEVVIAKRGDETIRIGDVANVVKGHQALIGDAVIDGGPGLMMIVEKLPWGNTLDVTKGVEQAIDEMRPGLPGLNIDTTIFRPGHVRGGGAQQPGLVARARFAPGRDHPGAVPLRLAQRAHQRRHHPGLAGGGRARPVRAGHDHQHDGAGRVRHRTRERSSTTPSSTSRTSSGGSDWPPCRAARCPNRRSSSSRRSRSGARSSTRSFIEALALLPIFFLEGLTGAFFRPLAFSYALAVLVSLLVALILTPALSMILFSRAKIKRADAPLVRGLQSGLRPDPDADREEPDPGLRRRRHHRRRRVRRGAPARSGAPAELQGAGLPHALRHQARHLAGRGGADHHRVGEGAAGDPRRPQLRGPHRPGPRVGRAGRPGVR